MQPTTSFNWRRVIGLTHWIASALGGAALVVWVIWSFFLEPYGTGNANSVQWAVWAILGISVAIAAFQRGAGELGGGLVLVGGAVAMGVLSEFQGPAVLAVPLCAVAGLLFFAGGWYTLAHSRAHAHLTT